MSTVYINEHTTYTPKAEGDAARVAKQAAVAEPGPTFDESLDKLDAAIAELDDLTTKAQAFPSTIVSIDAKMADLESQDLSNLEALESRQAQQGKLNSMKLLAAAQQKRMKVSIANARENIIKLGTIVVRLLDQRWYELYTKVDAEAAAVMTKYFYHTFSLTMQNQYKGHVLLASLKFPPIQGWHDKLKIVKFRQLRYAVSRVKEFEVMTLEDVSARLDEMDHEQREQLRVNRGTQPKYKVFSPDDKPVAPDKPGMNRYGYPQPKPARPEPVTASENGRR